MLSVVLCAVMCAVCCALCYAVCCVLWWVVGVVVGAVTGDVVAAEAKRLRMENERLTSEHCLLTYSSSQTIGWATTSLETCRCRA